MGYFVAIGWLGLVVLINHLPDYLIMAWLYTTLAGMLIFGTIRDYVKRLSGMAGKAFNAFYGAFVLLMAYQITMILFHYLGGH